MGDCTKLFHCIIVIILGFLNCVCVGHAYVLPVCMHVEAGGLPLSSSIVFLHIYVFKHLYFMYRGVLPAHVSVHHVCVPGALKVRRGNQVRWDWGYSLSLYLGARN